jgi:hypothetical protein
MDRRVVDSQQAGHLDIEQLFQRLGSTRQGLQSSEPLVTAKSASVAACSCSNCFCGAFK